MRLRKGAGSRPNFELCGAIQVFTLRTMKLTCRIAVLLAAAVLITPGAVAAQNSTSAIAAGLAREQMEENIKALLTDVEDLRKTTLALDRRIAALEAENRQLREEIKAAGSHGVSPDALKRLSEQIQEV